jgi:5-methylthioadenosine/S-adenosylhomocysteine deaminase
MFEQMKLAAILAKVTTMDPTAVSASKALEMATINGARALGMAVNDSIISPQLLIFAN